MKILIVEVDRVLREVLVKFLRKCGYGDIVVTEDGQAAWAAFQKHQPECIISDVALPHINGFELCKRVRNCNAREKTHTYFIFLAALTAPENRYVGLEDCGADDYLYRPFDELSLRVRLRTTAKSVEVTRALRKTLESMHSTLRVDPLTDVGNRRRLDEDLVKLIGHADRYGEGFSVALCDIDFFKSYNDTYGHPQGDVALQATAATLDKANRGSDSVYRYGGEEFLVAFPNQTLAEATIAMERRRVLIEAEGLVTISCGVAEYHPDDTPSSVISRADRALYSAKDNGRNQVWRDDD